MSYSKSPKLIDDLNDVDTTTVVPVTGDILYFDGTNWVPQQILPVAKITRTSKVSNILTVDASSSSANLDGDTLTYLWTVTPTVPTTVIGTPTASSTTIKVLSGKGEFTINLTVTSTLTGKTATDTYKFKYDTIIEVMGTDAEHNDLFQTLASAYNWITTNDSANAANYTIKIMSQTTDSGNITPVSGVKVHFEPGGVIGGAATAIQIQCGTGTFRFSGSSKDKPHINAAGGSLVFSGTANTVLVLDNLYINGTGGSSLVFFAAGSSSITITNCILITDTGNGIHHNTTGTVIVRNTTIQTGSSAGNNGINAFGQTCTYTLENCTIIAGSDSYGVSQLDSTLIMNNCFISNTIAGVNVRTPLEIALVANANTISRIRNCTFETNGVAVVGTALPAARVRGVAGNNVVFENCNFYSPTGEGFLRVSPTTPILRECTLMGGRNSLLSSTGVAAILAINWVLAPVEKCLFINAIGPTTSTFVASTALGADNTQVP